MGAHLLNAKAWMKKVRTHQRKPGKNADFDPVISSASQDQATFCIHVPVADVNAPVRIKRKSRQLSA
jgi:hypothetical protein